MNRPLSEFSGVKHKPDIRPDVVGLTHEGTIDIWEILSPSQYGAEGRLEAKLIEAMRQLPPDMRGGFSIIDPRDALP
jgi:hypothetical protein